MLIVEVKLLSANTGKITTLARMEISNDGTGDERYGNYAIRTMRGRSDKALCRRTPQRKGEVKSYPRLSLHVWHLVARALKSVGYE